MVNRNDAALVATGVNGTVVFRNGQFRHGYGTTVKSGRFLRAALNPSVLLTSAAKTAKALA